ncbi:MAG: enoyl-CoA hydratase/isomerase family protein [Anaerolineales bacterium]|nr:enoyl-CoA hydratase/isomerase family protein [Anaerolineales bacterium]
MDDKEFIVTEFIGKVGLVKLNRPESYNALNLQVLTELMESLKELDERDDIGAIVITGDEKAFAAGADISAMADATTEEIKKSAFIPTFSLIREIKKPILAAVSGYCLGGGLELAMSCDMIIASTKSKFGQPEINLGIIPGAGGTQRLTRSVGKVVAMEMILNNRTLKAEEALSLGLINAVYPVEEFLEKSMSLAQDIAARAPLAIQSAKRAINQAYELNLTKGLDEERDLFFDLFSTQDQKEGMKAFLEKRKPSWTGN